MKRRHKVHQSELGKAEWKTPVAGYCQCGCQPPLRVPHLERHHIFALEMIRRERRDDMAWDLRNSILLAPQHHHWHTTASRRLPVTSVLEAFEFGVELLGKERAEDYLKRYYDAQEFNA